MTADPRRVKELFAAAVDLSDPQARQALLDRECGDDADLRKRIDKLLCANDEPASALDKPFAAPSPEFTSDFAGACVGTVIAGRFKLLEELGEGGMGSVWVAEQTQPVRRKVAVKLIKPGMDSKTVLSRFEAERQALALMDHPNIAKVLDGGRTEQGRPFFVMEYVKGVPITKYCDNAQLTVRERLELFIPVCQAVQHAHQKGIIHRDLKPSNILICLYDGRPVPKVIDFGLAKALHQSLTEHTLYTAHGLMLGTPMYMSPEQAEFNNLDVDTRTDVYSLGVLLYELLTGSTPLEKRTLKEAAWQEMVRLIKEVEPPRPSTRLSSSGSLASVAAQRKIEPAKLSRLVRGELDWIVMKALEKDRGRRYETANGLARDVQRYLTDETVEACPPSVGYRLRKFARKHRAGLTAIAAFAVLLLTGIAVSGSLAVRATRAEEMAIAVRDIATDQRHEAEQQRDRALAAERAAQAERDKTETARTLADRNFQKAQAAVENYLQKVTDNLDLKDNSAFRELRKQLLVAALPFFEEFVKEKSDDPKVRLDQGKAYRQLARVRHEIGERQAALRDFAAARNILTKLAADHSADPDYRHELGKCYCYLGHLLMDLKDVDEAEAAYRQTLAIQERLVSDFPVVVEYRKDLASTYNHLALLLRNNQRRPDAEVAYRQAAHIAEKLATNFPAVAEYRSDLSTYCHNLSIVLNYLGKRTESEVAIRQALAIDEKLAADFPAEPLHRMSLAFAQTTLAELFQGWDRPADSEAAFRRALAVREKLAADFPSRPDYRQDVAETYGKLGELHSRAPGMQAEAEADYSRKLAIEEKLVADFPSVRRFRRQLAFSHVRLGGLLSRSEKQGEAETNLRKALAMWQNLVADFPDVDEYRNSLAHCYGDLATISGRSGKLTEAEAAYRKAVDIREKLVAEFPKSLGYCSNLANAHHGFSRFLTNVGKLAEAESEYGRVVAIWEKLAADFPTSSSSRTGLSYALRARSKVLRRLARPAEAVQDCDRALALDDGRKQSEIRLARAAALLLQNGDHVRAAADAEELTRDDKVSGEALYAAAGVSALASAAAKDNDQRRDSYAAQALALLRRAQRTDYFGYGGHVAELKADPDFTALRGREDYAELLRELTDGTPVKK